MKKLLFILLCLPMICFGQDDKLDIIIFSNGDTIYGSVIEVGVNNIKYQHLDESVNYVSKKTEILKIVYSSGRTENFEGVLVKQFQEKKYNINKIRKERREERRNNLSAFGLIGGVNNSNIRGQNVEETESRTGIYFGMFLKRKYLGIKWSPEIIFQQRGMTKSVEGFFDINNILEKLQANYITLGLNTSFEIEDIEFTVGPFLSYAVSGESIVWGFSKNGNVSTENILIRDDDLFNRTELGGKLGISYFVNNHFQICINYEVSLTPVYRDKEQETTTSSLTPVCTGDPVITTPHTNANSMSAFQDPEGKFYYSALKFGFKYTLGNK